MKSPGAIPSSAKDFSVGAVIGVSVLVDAVLASQVPLGFTKRVEAALFESPLRKIVLICC